MIRFTTQNGTTYKIWWQYEDRALPSYAKRTTHCLIAPITPEGKTDLNGIISASAKRVNKDVHNKAKARVASLTNCLMKYFPLKVDRKAAWKAYWERAK